MQIAICAAIICCTTYIGFGLSDYYVKREKLFFELTQFCERLKADINFLLKPLDEILTSAKNEYSSILVNIVDLCRETLQSGSPLNSEYLYGKITSGYIGGDEKNIICGFFSILGKSDRKTQIESIDNFRERFMLIEKSCNAERKKFSPMLKKLGFLCGAAACLFAL